MIPDCTWTLFYEPMRVKNLSVKNFEVLKDLHTFRFSPGLNIILGENAAGKTSIIKALNILLARREFKLWDLTLFSDGQKNIQVDGEFYHNEDYYLARKKVHRGAETFKANIPGNPSRRFKKKTYKKAVKNIAGNYTLISTGSNTVFDLLQDEGQPYRLVKEANPLLEYAGLRYRLGIKNGHVVVYQGGFECPFIGSGHDTLLRVVVLLAREKLKHHPRVIILDDNFGTHKFCSRSWRQLMDVVQQSGLQVLAFCVENRFIRSFAEKNGVLVKLLKRPDIDLNNYTVSIAARRLIEMQEYNLQEKINTSLSIIRSALEKSKNPIISWSGGRDSEVLMYLVHLVDPSVPAQFFNTKIELPDHIRYVRKRIREIENTGVRVYKTKPKMNFWDVTRHYGFPLLGKAFRKHSNPEDYERVNKLGVNVAHENCCRYLKEIPAKELAEQLNTDLQFIGTRAGESDNRRKHFYKYGSFHYAKTDGVWRCKPLSHWKSEDINEFIRQKELPVSPIYELGFSGSGCAPCAMDIKHQGNNLEVLRLVYPGLWRSFVVKGGLGKEIAKLNLGKTEQELLEEGHDIEQIAEKKPCFFDRV